MRSAESEQVIAIDGLAVIVNPANPVQSLSVEQVARLFAGEIVNWRELGGANAAVELHARDDQSGTYDTFKELVLGSQGKVLGSSAARYESNDALSQAVSTRPGAIGFVGLASVGQSKALAITDGDSQPMPPSTALVATEDYPLSRRLFLYADPKAQSPGPENSSASYTARPGKRSLTGRATSPRPSHRSNCPCRPPCPRPTSNWPRKQSA